MDRMDRIDVEAVEILGVGGVGGGLPAPPVGCGGVPPALGCLLHILLLVEVVLLLLVPCLLLILLLLLMAILHVDRLASHYLDCCFRLLGSAAHLVDHLVLLPLALYAEVSTALDMKLHLELHWHVGVVAAVALEELYYDLSGLLENDAALELLCPVELLLERILHSVCVPWKVVLLQHNLDEVGFH